MLLSGSVEVDVKVSVLVPVPPSDYRVLQQDMGKVDRLAVSIHFPGRGSVVLVIPFFLAGPWGALQRRSGCEGEAVWPRSRSLA